MKRKHAARNVAPMPAKALTPGDWRSALTSTISEWTEVEDGHEVRLSVGTAIFFGLSATALLLPVYFLGLGLASLISVFKGSGAIPAATFLLPQIWLPVAGTGLAVGAILFFLQLKRRVISFKFDAAAQQVEYTTRRWFVRAKPIRLPFNAVLAVVPTLMQAYAEYGHFDITLSTPRGRIETLWVGARIPVAELGKHSEWLKQHLGERVRPLLTLDC